MIAGQLEGLLGVVIGQYVQKRHLRSLQRNLTETGRAWQRYGRDVIPRPHSSPRNNIWIKKNPWFVESLLPVLRQSVRDAME